MTSMRLMPSEIFSDQIDALKFRIGSFLNGNTPSKGVTLLFTSCEEGEGVSSIAANFAASLSEEDDKTILLMDCNLRNPCLKSILCANTALERKISDPENEYNCGSVWKMVRIGDNMDALLAEKVSFNGRAVFQKHWFAEMMSQAQEQYDFIIIDAPPVGSDISAAFLSSQSHGVVLVIEAEKVRREVIQRSISLLEDSGARVIGAVLNKRKYPIPASVYKFL